MIFAFGMKLGRHCECIPILDIVHIGLDWGLLSLLLLANIENMRGRFCPKVLVGLGQKGVIYWCRLCAFHCVVMLVLCERGM